MFPSYLRLKLINVYTSAFIHHTSILKLSCHHPCTLPPGFLRACFSIFLGKNCLIRYFIFCLYKFFYYGFSYLNCTFRGLLSGTIVLNPVQTRSCCLCCDPTVGPESLTLCLPTLFQSQVWSIGKKEISVSWAQTHRTLTRSQILLA